MLFKETLLEGSSKTLHYSFFRERNLLVAKFSEEVPALSVQWRSETFANLMERDVKFSCEFQPAGSCLLYKNVSSNKSLR